MLRRRTWRGRLTWRGRCGKQVGAQAAGGAGVGAEPAAVQQRLQRARLAGWRLAAEAGAAALGVDAARLALAQRARQAAAAARLAHQLGTRGRSGRWRALGQRTRVARLAAHHGARARHARAGSRRRRPAEQRQRCQRRCPERGARPLHGARRGGLLLGRPGRAGTGRQRAARGCGSRVGSGQSSVPRCRARIWPARARRLLYRSRGGRGHAPERHARVEGWRGRARADQAPGALASPCAAGTNAGTRSARQVGHLLPPHMPGAPATPPSPAPLATLAPWPPWSLRAPGYLSAPDHPGAYALLPLRARVRSPRGKPV